jgi:hypothetical protein
MPRLLVMYVNPMSIHVNQVFDCTSADLSPKFAHKVNQGKSEVRGPLNLMYTVYQETMVPMILPSLGSYGNQQGTSFPRYLLNLFYWVNLRLLRHIVSVIPWQNSVPKGIDNLSLEVGGDTTMNTRSPMYPTK